MNLRIITFVGIFLFIKVDIEAQNYREYRIQKQPSYCSATVKFIKGGEFIYEHGCEESSHLYFGKWYKLNDTIKLQPYDNLNYNVKVRIDSSKKEGQYSSVKIFDKSNNDISLNIKFNYYDTLTNEPFVLGIGCPDLSLLKGKVRIETIYNIFNKQIFFYNNTNMDYKIYLEISQEFLFNANSIWEIPDKELFLIRNNCLVDVKSQDYYCGKE